jgi:hypothetical protein
LGPAKKPEEQLNQLLPFVERLRENRNAVSMTIITVELLLRSPQLLYIGFIPLLSSSEQAPGNDKYN